MMSASNDFLCWRITASRRLSFEGAVTFKASFGISQFLQLDLSASKVARYREFVEAFNFIEFGLDGDLSLAKISQSPGRLSDMVVANGVGDLAHGDFKLASLFRINQNLDFLF